MRRSHCRGVVSPGIVTCLPLFPGLPVGPRCPAIPGSPFGPISPWKEEREVREELGHVEQAHVYRSIQSLAVRAVYLIIPDLSQMGCSGRVEEWCEVMWKADRLSMEKEGKEKVTAGGWFFIFERQLPANTFDVSNHHPEWRKGEGGSCISVICVPVTLQAVGGKLFLF